MFPVFHSKAGYAKLMEKARKEIDEAAEKRELERLQSEAAKASTARATSRRRPKADVSSDDES